MQHKQTKALYALKYINKQVRPVYIISQPAFIPSIVTRHVRKRDLTKSLKQLLTASRATASLLFMSHTIRSMLSQMLMTLITVLAS